MWSYNDDTKSDEYNLDKARKMLEKAGVKNLSMKVWAMPVARPYMLNARRAAEIIQADFAKIGVKVEIVTYEWGEYIKRAADPKHDGAIILGWTSDNGDPDNFIGTLLSCDSVGTSNNPAAFCNPEFDELVKKAKVVSEKAERARFYKQAQVVFKGKRPGRPSIIRWSSFQCAGKSSASSESDGSTRFRDRRSGPNNRRERHSPRIAPQSAASF